MRDKSIDAAKGLGIIFVVMGHVCTGIPWMVKWIYSFHMPLFFMISGYLQEGKEYGDFLPYLKKKMISLLYPYYVFALLGTVGTALKVRDNEILIHTFFSRLFGITMEENAIGAIWFLLVLFETEILDYIIEKTGKLWLVLVCGVLGSIFVVTSVQIPFMLHLCFTAIVFFYIGKHLKRYLLTQINCDAYGWIVIVGSLIINVVSMHWNRRIDMYLFQYGNIVLFWSETVCGSLGIIMLALLLGRRHSWKWLDRIGKESLIIMAVHSYIYMIVCIGIDKMLGIVSNHILCNGLISVIWSGVLVFLSYMSAKIIQRFFPVLIRPQLIKKRE